MQCECHKKVEAKLNERALGQLPEGSREFSGKLNGYVFLLGGDNGLSEAPAMEYACEWEQPKKKGGFIQKKHKSKITANYCPFCGKSVKQEEAANG